MLNAATVVMCYVLVVFFSFILAEVLSYLWHRYLAHRSWISNLLHLDAIRQSHRFHHTSSLEHNASEDFVWIVYGLILIVVLVGTLVRVGALDWFNRTALLCLFATSVFVFILNWYVHLSVHTDGHWLQSFDYIRDLKDIHFIHHRNPYSNYSIMNLMDTTFNTFSTHR